MNATSHQLPVLPATHRRFITDIYIPFSQSDGATEAEPDQAVCYIGQAQPFKLFDDHSREQFAWFTRLWTDASKTVETGEDYRIHHDTGFFRAHRMSTAEGYMLALRSIPKRTPDLVELPKPALWDLLLMDPDLLYGGLIMLCGTNGMGKTTIAASTTVSRLKKFGGHANTAEDPIEYPMQGVHSGEANGWCLQHSVNKDKPVEEGKSVYSQALSDALRAFPAITGGGTILMVGEVRDPETAAEVLLAASNGHLVITTYHGHSLTSAIARFLSMAQKSLRETARDLFAASLRVAIHQKLRFDDKASPENAEPWKRGKFEGTILWNDRNESSSIQESLRDTQSIVHAVHGIVQHQQRAVSGPTPITSLVDFKRYAATMPSTAKS